MASQTPKEEAPFYDSHRRNIGHNRVAMILIVCVLLLNSIASAQQSSQQPTFSPQISNLLQQLQQPGHQHRHDRDRAAEALVATKPLPPDVLIAMLRLASTNNPSVGKAMAKAGPQVLPPVIAAIHNSDMWVRMGAVTILGQMANQSATVWPALIDALSDHDGTVSGQAEVQFGRASEADASSIVVQLRPLLKGDQPEPRIAALHALQHMGAKARDATPDLATLLKNDQTEVRSEAANTLRLVGPGAKAADESLHAALKDPDPHVRAQAAFALCTIDPHDQASRPALIEALVSNGDDAWRAVEIVGAMGSDARDIGPVLAHSLAAGRDGSLPDTYSDARLRTTIAENLGKIWGTQADAALSDALAKDQSDDVRSAALASIENLRADGAGAIPGLIQALRDKNRGTREHASTALAKLGKPALAPLIAALHNPDLYIREGAVDALAQYQPLPNEAVRALTDSAFKDQSHTVKEAAANALSNAQIPAGDAASAQLQNEEEAEQAARSVDESKRRYTKEDIVADVPADADHEYAMTLKSLLTIDGTDFVVTLYSGQDLDRVAIWKKTAANRYQRIEEMEAEAADDESFQPPTVVNLKTSPSGDELPFLYIIEEVYRGVAETLFAIDKDNDALEPVEIESAKDWFGQRLRSGEGISIYSGNRFENDKVPEFVLHLTKPTDPNCCPSAGKVTGRYLIVKEIGSSKRAGEPRAITWKLVPADETDEVLRTMITPR